MNLRYRVHSANRVQVDQEVELAGGQKVQAKVTVLEVELVPEGHAGGSLVLRPTVVGDAEGEALRETFAVDGLIEFTASRVEG